MCPTVPFHSAIGELQAWLMIAWLILETILPQAGLFRCRASHPRQAAEARGHQLHDSITTQGSKRQGLKDLALNVGQATMRLHVRATGQAKHAGKGSRTQQCSTAGQEGRRPYSIGNRVHQGSTAGQHTTPSLWGTVAGQDKYTKHSEPSNGFSGHLTMIFSVTPREN